MDRALSEFEVEGRGVKTTIPLHRRLLAHPDFRTGDVSTDFLEKAFFGASAAA
jgi:acetyl-CoA carboxylase, biotin carboxylase subunit